LRCNTWAFLFCQYHRLKLKFIKPYTLQLKQRFQRPYLASSLPEDEQALLASIFTPAERAVAEYRWLRTCYSDADGRPTDQAHASLLAQSGLLHINGLDLDTFILDDAARYKYDSEWQKIFLRIPQLVDRPPFKSISPADFEAGKKTAIKWYEEADGGRELSSRSGNIVSVLRGRVRKLLTLCISCCKCYPHDLDSRFRSTAFRKGIVCWV
jgi:hypothetical protein